MKHAKPKTQKLSRVDRHRKKVAASGARRVEVTVSSHDAPLVKAIAGALRAGGDEAKLIRQSLQPLLAVPKEKKEANWWRSSAPRLLSTLNC